MTRDSIIEVVSAAVLCLIAVLLLNPMHFWMPSMAHMTALALGLVAFGVFSVFVLKEGSGDEREDAHRERAGRLAFLVGSIIILIGIAVQSSEHMLDAWLLIALVAMVVAKVAARLWSMHYR